MSDLVSQNLNMIFKTPKGETVHALKDVSFTLKKGELLTVLGPSGCGKTTLLNITAGFLRPTSGKITLNNNEIDGPGVERGMVFQQGALFEWLTVAENVNFGLRMKSEDPEVTAKKVEEWLDIVGQLYLTILQLFLLLPLDPHFSYEDQSLRFQQLLTIQIKHLVETPFLVQHQVHLFRCCLK